MDISRPDRPVSSSNRKETCPFSGHTRFGIDRLSVSFPVENVAQSVNWHQNSTVNTSAGAQWSRSDRVTLAGGATAMIGVREIIATGQTWAKVEFNPSRIWDPEGHSLATPLQAVEALDQVVGVAIDEGYFDPLVGSVAEMNCKRLDVAADFGNVHNPEHIIGGLIGVHRPYARKTGVFHDSQRSGAQTLLVGGRQSEVRLYDKEAETKAAVTNTLRWEGQCRSNWLDRYGDIKRVSDITPSNVESLGMNRWDWSAMGQQVVSTAQMVTDIVSRSELSPTEQQRLLGLLMQQAYGVSVRQSRTTASKYRKIARELGISMALDGLECSGDGFVSQLDIDSLMEVVSV